MIRKTNKKIKYFGQNAECPRCGDAATHKVDTRKTLCLNCGETKSEN